MRTLLALVTRMVPLATRTALLTTLTALAACQTPPQSCGEYPAGGGPAVIRTQDQEACELVRQRVLRHMKTAETFSLAWAEGVWEASEVWSSSKSLEDLVARVRKDAGDAFADDVKRGIDGALAGTKQGSGPDCGDAAPEKCLVLGAAKGARMALRQRGYFARGTQRPSGDGDDAAPRRERVDLLEEMLD